MPKIRLNKWISDSGFCSRREADRRIASGEVCVNGKVITTMGIQIDPAQDKVTVGGRAIQSTVDIPKRYVLLHKPTGVVTTRKDERDRQTIYDLLPKDAHALDPGGRLDRDSSGALILSDDGAFLYRVMHPRFHLPKHYRVTLERPFRPSMLPRLLAGVPLAPEGVLAKAEIAEVESANVLRVTLKTGYNRQIRRMFEALGHRVKSLKRTAVGPVQLGNLRPGAWRALSAAELRELKTLLGAWGQPEKRPTGPVSPVSKPRPGVKKPPG